MFDLEESAVLAARDVVKHLEEAEIIALPCEVVESGSPKTFDYDDAVELIEGIFRHYLNLPARGEKSPFIHESS